MAHIRNNLPITLDELIEILLPTWGAYFQRG